MIAEFLGAPLGAHGSVVDRNAGSAQPPPLAIKAY